MAPAVAERVLVPDGSDARARARIFGGETFEDYVSRCGELSLLDQCLLDQPSAPILLVNGRDDVQNSIDGAAGRS